MAQSHPLAWQEHASHGSGVGAMGCDLCAVIQEIIRQESFVALEQYPFVLGLELKEG